MTRAPANLLAARRLLLDHLDMHEGRTVDADLDPAEVGIVGNSDHWGGYHCGSDRITADDYSVRESSRDRGGLTLDAAALDVGEFSVTTRLGTFDLRHYSRWLVRECANGSADTRDIREVIYSPDGKVVKRWDRLGRRTTGDKSHLTHTHESYFRDAIKAGRDLTAVKRRYLTTIGLIEATSPGDTMALTPEDISAVATKVWAATYGSETAGSRLLDARNAAQNADTQAMHALGELAYIKAILLDMSSRDYTDEPAIIAGILAGLDPAVIAAAIPTDLAQRVADELAARLATAPQG